MFIDIFLIFQSFYIIKTVTYAFYVYKGGINMKYIDKKKMKEILTVEDIAEKYSPQILSKTKITYMICPFHDDKNLGSCYVQTGHNNFICKACGAKGDMLKLASGYTAIPLTSLNELLEKLVSDFGIPRDVVVCDNGCKNSTYSICQPHLLTDDEYIRLTGVSVIKTVKETKTERLNGKEYNIPTGYQWEYLRSLAKKNPVQYDFEIITRSRVIWKKLFDLKKAIKENDELKSKIKYYLSRTSYPSKSSFNTRTAAEISKSSSVEIIIDSLIKDGNELLKRGVINSQSLEEEGELRKGIIQREQAKQEIINLCLKKKSL